MQSIWSFNIMQNAYIENRNKDALPTLAVSSTISQKFEKALEISSPTFTDLPFATFLPGDAQLLQ